MKLGYAAPLEAAETLARIGYDYIEVPLVRFDLTTATGTRAAISQVKAAPLPCLVLQSFIPPTLPVVGPHVDERAVRTWFGHAAELAEAVGATAAVFGAAWSRNVPDGWSRDATHDQLVTAFTWTAEAFAGSGCVVGIEPQNVKEANIVRFLDEAVGYAQEVGRPGEIKVAVDFYHLDEEGTPLASISRFGEWICTVQTADTGRRHPGTGQYDYATFCAELDKVGYDDTLSVEIMHEISEAEMRDALTFLRGYWPPES